MSEPKLEPYLAVAFLRSEERSTKAEKATQFGDLLIFFAKSSQHAREKALIELARDSTLLPEDLDAAEVRVLPFQD